jgi:alkaline phosphatase D
VKWTIWADEARKRVVRQGTAVATPELGHSVHVEAEGLAPARHYWYEFECGGVRSPLGRTRTAPALDAHPDALSFAFASCQNWPNGYYAAYRDMADRDLDLVLHLGDYIYEGDIKPKNQRKEEIPDAVRAEPMTLEQYRLRYALYKSDPHLIAAHAIAPWIVTWDDHEVDNNYAADHDQDGSTSEAFLKRRAAAYQAYYEHMPLRKAQMAHGPDLQLYRRLAYGDLAEFNVLDTRQYRSDQAHGDKAGPRDTETDDPSRVLMGAKQEAWLKQGLKDSHAKWNVIPQQIWMMQVANRNAKNETIFSTDNWDGYPAERNRLMRFFDEAKIPNLVVLTGDAHKNLVGNLKADYERPTSATVGVELAGTAISSSGIDPKDAPKWDRRIANEPHLKWFEGVKRGYVTCTLDRKMWHADFWGVEELGDPNSKVTRSARFTVQNGVPGIEKT